MCFDFANIVNIPLVLRYAWENTELMIRKPVEKYRRSRQHSRRPTWWLDLHHTFSADCLFQGSIPVKHLVCKRATRHNANATDHDKRISQWSKYRTNILRPSEPLLPLIYCWLSFSDAPALHTHAIRDIDTFQSWTRIVYAPSISFKNLSMMIGSCWGERVDRTLPFGFGGTEPVFPFARATAASSSNFEMRMSSSWIYEGSTLLVLFKSFEDICWVCFFLRHDWHTVSEAEEARRHSEQGLEFDFDLNSAMRWYEDGLDNLWSSLDTYHLEENLTCFDESWYIYISEFSEMQIHRSSCN